ncbi:S-methyl-5-thioribose-1-phosphate isomerase [Rhodospirillum sp. A1_3_36]|uniref:S-methyl-5-thioribose-1-phosphate isomerase n=1 Tax=Rhodospirillum sp. A1_3_36 TaxID=3391666 RepID=UPI0039A6DB29
MLDTSKLKADSLVRAVRWENRELFLLDQTRLPGEVIEERQETVQQVWESIKALKVRGAPAIGIAGAYGLLVALREKLDLSQGDFMEEVRAQAAYLDSSRPTAVNLGWALRRLVKKAEEADDKSPRALFEVLVAEAEAIHQEDRMLCRGMGVHGAPLIKEGMGVLTHCNAGALATSELGTALAPMYVAQSQGINFRVYADETRPLLQGARLTSWELQQSGIDVTLITDNMAAHIMSQGLVDLVIVGTDRVAANGDVANKIGTMGVAILANYFGIPFYVACPSSTIDFDTAHGKDIPIEERDGDEVCEFGARRTAPPGMKTRNPAFDVTPNALVAGLITEKGIIRAPYVETLAKTFQG